MHLCQLEKQSNTGVGKHSETKDKEQNSFTEDIWTEHK